MPTPNPHLYPEAWDYIYIGGQLLPLLCIVSEPKKKNSWDVKRGKGVQGAQYTYQGIEPARFSITFRLWQTPGVTVQPGGQDDWLVWDDFAPLFEYDPTKKKTTAIDIAHPTLIGAGVSACITEDIGGIVPKDAENPDGEYRVTVSFISYTPAPPHNVSANPNGSAAGIPNKGIDHTNPPTDAQLLAQLEAQAQSTS